MEWEFDIALSTHELLKQGTTTAEYRHIIVLSDTYLDASLTAYAIASREDTAVVTDILYCL